MTTPCDKVRQAATDLTGNTKDCQVLKTRVSEARHWFFTYNNYAISTMETMATTLRKNTEKYCFQEEKGEEKKTKHIQGYIHFTYKKRLTAVRKILPQAHWEVSRDPSLSIAYCTKKETRDGRMWLYNIEVAYDGSDIIKELRPWQKLAYEILQNEPDPRLVYWFWETKGGMGKSAFAKYMAHHHDACVVASAKKTDLLQIIKNHTNKRMFIIDLGRSTEERAPYEVVEQLKNGHITCGKYESSTHMFNPPHVIIFSNHEPNKGMLSEDRWAIIDLLTTDIALEIKALSARVQCLLNSYPWRVQ